MPERILVVDDEQIIRESLGFILVKAGYEVSQAANGKDAANLVSSETFDLVVTDLEMPEMKGIELLEHIMLNSPETMVIIITAFGSLETAIDALRKGASDYILKPVEFDELLAKVNLLLEHKKLKVENQTLRRMLHKEYDFSNIIGKSQAMQRVFTSIQKVAATSSNVLITGKSGAGKELVARAIHYNGPRMNNPFITVNCGAIPETLIESELFGSKKGSFTGSTGDKTGYFKAADGGTLFLDEIGEMPLQLQVKLLRAIELKEITPIGSSASLKIDVRFIAATNKILLKEVEAGNFREDLFYRLNVVEIQLPALAERQEDIPPLVEHFLAKYRRELNKNILGVDAEAMRLLMNRQWKGEIRELENIIERAVIFCDGDFISIRDLPDAVPGAEVDFDEPMMMLGEDRSLDEAMRFYEKRYIASMLKIHANNKDAVAKALKIALPTLYRRLKDLAIVIEKK